MIESHCTHECVCNKYIDHTNTGATPGRKCNGETWCFKPCPHDTRNLEYENLKLLDELYRYACINKNGQGFASGVDEFREIKINECKGKGGEV